MGVVGGFKEGGKQGIPPVSAWLVPKVQRVRGGHSRSAKELERWDLEEWRERYRPVVSLLASLVRVACGFPGSICWSWGLRQSNEFGGRILEGKICVIHWRWVQKGGGGEGLQQVCCCRAGEDWRIWCEGSEEWPESSQGAVLELGGRIRGGER